MADRAALAAFVLSMLGATYQMLSYGLAFLVDNRTSFYYYNTIFGLNIIANFLVFWAASHLVGQRTYRSIAWPSIILAIGAANLGNMIIQWSTTPTGSPFISQTVPVDIVLTLVPGPL